MQPESSDFTVHPDPRAAGHTQAMCFSAEASFAGAAVVGVCGIGSLALVRDKREILFAALPLGFGIHQALEGFTWLDLRGLPDGSLNGWAVHLWVLFAWALLPTWVSLAVWLLEPDPKRRRVMAPLVVIGVVLTVFMLTQAFQPGIEVRVIADNLDYVLPFSASWALALPYVAATCLTPTLCTKPYVMVFGIGNFIAMSAAALLKAADYSSIWCTFAAFLSIIIFAHMLSEWRAHRAGPPIGAPTPAVEPLG
jgi:hypothetical protein